MLTIRPLFLENVIGITEDVMAALDYALGTGNSARFVRGAILPLALVLLWGGERLYQLLGGKFNERGRRFLRLGGQVLLQAFPLRGAMTTALAVGYVLQL